MEKCCDNCFFGDFDEGFECATCADTVDEEGELLGYGSNWKPLK